MAVTAFMSPSSHLIRPLKENIPSPKADAGAAPALVTIHGDDGCSLCIECGKPVTEGLYREYSKDNIRLSRCEFCGAVADRLIEYELVLVGLDLALHRLPAWRHILFNRQPHAKLEFAQLWRMALVLTLVDTHIKYAIYVHYSSISPPKHLDLTDTPKYQLSLLLRILLLSFVEHFVFFGIIVFLTTWMLAVRLHLCRPQLRGPASTPYTRTFVTRKLVQALLFPNFGRCIVIFVMVWDPAFVVANLISLLVLLSQWQALRAVVAAAIALNERYNQQRKEDSVKRGNVEFYAAALPFVVGLSCKCLLRLVAFHVDASCTNLYLV